MEKDRVLAEIREAIELNKTVRQKTNDALCHAEHLLKLEDEYNRGLNDAWELAKKIALSTNMVETAQIFISNMICGIEQRRLFGDCFALTPQEALSKLEAYEKSKDEIKVGDVVVIDNEFKDVGVVIHLENNWANLVHNDGLFSAAVPVDTLTKTGKHIDISALLAEIGKEQV